MAHTQLSQAQPGQPGLLDGVQPAPVVTLQSTGQTASVSPGSHLPLPHVLAQRPLQLLAHSDAHCASHSVWQQYASMAQTHASHAQPSHPVWLVALQPVLADGELSLVASTAAGQSPGQVCAVSPSSHTPLPHVVSGLRRLPDATSGSAVGAGAGLPSVPSMLTQRVSNPAARSIRKYRGMAGTPQAR